METKYRPVLEVFPFTENTPTLYIAKQEESPMLRWVYAKGEKKIAVQCQAAALF